MREIYHWTEWFSELANKIAEGGEGFLIDCAKQIDWEAAGKEPPLLHHGDENINPFSFFYTLAQRRSLANRKLIYRSVEEVFNMECQLPAELYDSKDAFIFPTPSFKVLFLGDPQLLWNLFRSAVRGLDLVDPKHFNDALELRDVRKAKLTQTLFLINSSEFLPCDDTLKIFVDLPPDNEFNWKSYLEWLQKVHDILPGCGPYEINFFAYLYGLWKKENLPIGNKYFQVSTNAWGENGGDFWQDNDPELDFEPNNWVFVGGENNYPLGHPRPGDIMLVRTGGRGRGIGIVHKNEYQDGFDKNRRLHVLWLNKMSADVPQMNPRLLGLSYSEKTTDAFRLTPTYRATFELLDRLSGSEEPMPNQGTQQNPVKHPLNQILYGPPGTGKTYHTVDRALAIIDGESVEDVEHDIKRFRELRDSGQIAMVTFHQNFAYEDFIEGIRPVLDDGADGQIKYERHDGIFKRIAEAAIEVAIKEKDKRFVLIIDEINRGNIAKIFGELITLIEDSRRLAADDETKVMLPYSNESFGVPNNLYLIGTMNTADRSIQLLDTALRRRFDFVEMMPKPELISDNVKGVNCKRMLEEMNKRITVLLDRERQIGHTYLLDVDTMEKLSYAFQNKIFPLLQEYFFDDWSKIRAVLQENSFVSEQNASNLFTDPEQADEDRKIYERLPDNNPRWIAPEEYKKIYDGDSGDDVSDR
ncbi:MAG: AAA family ATPase [Gemmatimonadetes bacterium]|nr:AAA family ATPase [Gemmatimonadota bacterium]